ncbi:hypothetical protein L6216_09500 [Pseudomonas syringae pv. syringae]|uniref:hypothetical protein n=1 Tax=Pseudomonas syringae TaxID=317 RepID=UPI001F0D37E4|nr:hypothetical protein [Pseudomonas syringae]MCH5534394.1 hypothetical protein [Pseudomonas syringae pv. syringae]
MDSIKADTSQTLMRNARHQRLSGHYIQQALMSQVGFVGYIEFVVLNFVTAPSRCRKTRKKTRRTIAVRDLKQKRRGRFGQKGLRLSAAQSCH